MRDIWAIAATLLGIGAAQAAGNPLERYRWHARVLVISAPGDTDPNRTAQREILARARAGLEDRDLVILEALGDTAEARRLRASLKLPADQFRVVLVGKDGGAKRVETSPLPIDALFETIDAMPMRRDETRR